MTRLHADTCEADGAHDGDCATATELARLRAFAGAVWEEFACVNEEEAGKDGHVDDCWSCAAKQAVEGPR